MTKHAPPLASVLPSTSANVAHVVDRALAFERDERWPDARRMQEAVRHAYHDRHGSPISTAPRLTVPETVPNRTLPSAQGVLGPRLSTTGQPVARQPSRAAAPSRSARRRVAAPALAATMALGIAVAAIAATVSLHHRAQGTEPTALPSTSVRTVPAEVVSASAAIPPTPPATSEIAATDIPTATTTATTASVEATTTQVFRPPASAIAPPVATSKPSDTDSPPPVASAQPLPQIPSVSTFQQGLAASLPQARACLGPNDVTWRATLLFRSDGTVQHVEAVASSVTPDCSDNACLQQKAACLRTALTKTRVPPFTQPTFSVSATVRPN